MKLESLLQLMMTDDIIDRQIVSNQILIHCWQECRQRKYENTFKTILPPSSTGAKQKLLLLQLQYKFRTHTLHCLS